MVGNEVDLLRHYPRSPRDLDQRESEKTPEVRALARQFGREYFDGDRQTGYGGFHYNPRFWQPVLPDFVSHFGISGNSSVLDVGCAKGFMLHDLIELIPGVSVEGIDVSSYAIENGLDSVRPFLRLGDAKELPYDDDSFDFVFSINTVHNLEREQCGQALREIQRVARRGAFVTLDAYRDDDEKKRMYQWNLTGLTIMSVDEWKQFFEEVGYSGDYYWFIP
jgi:SAM-dependent methyltransferase